MADPLSLVVDMVTGLVSRVNEVKINHAGCQLLSSLARQTLEILERVQASGCDPTAWTALDHMQSALQEAHDVVDKCCNTDFLSALLYHEIFAASLKQAADKLKHALDGVPLASVSATADLQTDVEKLTKLIQGSSFVAKAEAAQKGKVLKAELEKAFHNNGEGSEQVHILVKDLLKENASSKDDLKGQLEMLKREGHQAKNEKGSQADFELTEIINVVTASLDDADELPTFALHVKNQIRCPLSREVMQDPVVLLESGVTYDRSSITEWIGAGNLRDPIKNTELKTAELMPNTALRDFCMAFFEEYGGPVLEPGDRQRGAMAPWIQAGMYEGRGKLDIGSSTILIFQMLILEPHGQAIGYTIYKPEVTNDNDQSLDIGGGEWDGNARQISYGDKKYSYEGNVTLDDNIREPGLEWKGKISISGNANEEYDFVCYYSPPPIAYEIWPRLGILQIEDAVTTKESLARYSSKVILSLESDAVIDGWMWFKSSTAKALAAGRIIGGKWNSDGYLWFKVYFPPRDIPLNSDSNPTNHFISLEIEGKINQGRGRLPASFVSKVVKIEKNGDWPTEKLPSISLDTLESLEYPCVREASTPWHYINPDPLRIFRVSRSTSNLNQTSLILLVLRL